MKFRKILSLLLMGIMFFTSSFSVYANENEMLYEDEKINNTLELVFEYLNNVELNATSTGVYEYKIPINDNEIITATIEIKEESLEVENFISGEDEFYVSANTLYTYSLVISPLDYVLGGDLVYNLKYKTKADPNDNIIFIEYYDSSINATPPNLYSLTGKDAYLYHVYGDMRFAAKAYITLSPLDGPFPLNWKVDVDVVSFGRGVVSIAYNYHLL